MNQPKSPVSSLLTQCSGRHEKRSGMALSKFHEDSIKNPKPGPKKLPVRRDKLVQFTGIFFGKMAVDSQLRSHFPD